MIDRVRKWYVGTYVPFKNEPSSGVYFFGGDFRRHWTARLVRVGVEFYLREWKWVIGTALAIVGISLAYIRAH